MGNTNTCDCVTNLFLTSTDDSEKQGEKQPLLGTAKAPTSVKISTTINVPDDYSTILEALAAARKDRKIDTIVLGAGEHLVQEDGNGKNYLPIDFPITILGDGDKNEVVVVGGFHIKKGVQGNVHVQNMTIRHSEGDGVYGFSPFSLEGVLVEQCRRHGVHASGTACVARCTNVEVRQCKYSGVNAYDGGSITLVGAKTTVHHNCTGGNGYHFGLRVVGATSKIPLLHPLTKESVATDNPGGGNWGAEDGSASYQIQTMTAEEYEAALQKVAEKAAAAAEKAAAVAERVAEVAARIKATGAVHVPEDYSTISDALDAAFKDRQIDTIVLGAGEHLVAKNLNGKRYLTIYFPITIVGNGDKKWWKFSNTMDVVVVGGFKIRRGARQGNVHVQNMTIRDSEGTGVEGHSPFTLKDVIVEQCGGNGVEASGTACVARCTNVEVRQCAHSGVVASSGGSITLMGAKTTVHHNCTSGTSGIERWCVSSSLAFGLFVVGVDSKIQLVHPLTKFSIATDNQGTGNWGAWGDGGYATINQIQTIPAE